VNEFHSLIAAVALRTARLWTTVNSATVDDLIQETYLKLCRDRRRLLGEFQADHPDSFKAYLSVITANVVHDHFRALHSAKRGAGKLDDPLEDNDAKYSRPLNEQRTIEQRLLMKEIDGVLCCGLPGEEARRNRVIFWLYYRDGWSAPDIAKLPWVSLTVKGVESVVHRLTKLVCERMIRDPRGGC